MIRPMPFLKTRQGMIVSGKALSEDANCLSGSARHFSSSKGQTKASSYSRSPASPLQKVTDSNGYTVTVA